MQGSEKQQVIGQLGLSLTINQATLTKTGKIKTKLV
jgi:hypothetical protein